MIKLLRAGKCCWNGIIKGDHLNHVRLAHM